MKEKLNDDGDKKKVNIFKLNFIFDDAGESFEKITERAFNRYCIRRCDVENNN